MATTTFVSNGKTLTYPDNKVEEAKVSIEREQANVKNIEAQAELHIAQAEAARANGTSEIANAPLVRDLLRIVREREKQEETEIEDLDETRYLDILRSNASTKKIGELISFVASFASDDPHDLISSSAKTNVRLDPSMANIPTDWSFFVSDRLEAHVLEVVSIINTTFYTNLGEASAQHFIECSDNAVRIRFHSAVAAMYRGSAVFSIHRYSTTKAIDTLQSNIARQLRFFSCVRIVDGSLKAVPFKPAPLPRNLYGI